MGSAPQEIFNSVQERQLLWFALRTLRLAPPAECFDILNDDYIVEVYMGQRQVYRTFNYYSISSYSLDELESIPWNQLFTCQDPAIEASIAAEIALALTERRIVYSQTPENLVCETSSPFKNEILYKLQFVVPLIDLQGHAQDCFMTVSTAQLIKTPSEAVRQQKQEEYEISRLMERSIRLSMKLN